MLAHAGVPRKTRDLVVAGFQGQVAPSSPDKETPRTLLRSRGIRGELRHPGYRGSLDPS